MLLWYVWMHIVDGAWHKLDEISKQLRIPWNAVSWAAKFLSEHGMAELGFEEDEIRLQKGHPRLEDVVKTLHGSPKTDRDSPRPSQLSTDIKSECQNGTIRTEWNCDGKSNYPNE